MKFPFYKALKVTFCFLALGLSTTGSLLAVEADKAFQSGYAGSPEQLHVYVIAGDSGVWGDAAITDDSAPVLPRCYILTEAGQWMDRNNISHAITHALRPTRVKSDQQRAFMRANFAKYKDRILRFTYLDPDEVSSVAEAVALLEREKVVGAVGFGEHYGRNRMFDDPANLLLYAACEQVDLPVMFDIDANKNMVEKDMRRVGRVLEMFPELILIAHADWWRYLPAGTCDRMLQDHPSRRCKLAFDGTPPNALAGLMHRPLAVDHAEKITLFLGISVSHP